MSHPDDTENEAPELDDEGVPLAGDFVEIDWNPLQAALDGMADEGLDLDDLHVVRDHFAALLASLLRRIRDEEDVSDEDLAEIAAETAALAVQIALSDEEVPEFAASEIEE